MKLLNSDRNRTNSKNGPTNKRRRKKVRLTMLTRLKLEVEI